MGVTYNDPLVESHMRHEHMWGRRSSKGHLGLLTFWLKFFERWSVIYFMGHGHNDPWVNLHISPKQVWGQI